MQRDLHHNIKVVPSVSPVAVGVTGTGQTGKPVDRRGYQGVEILVSYGSITATNAAFTVVVKEGDATGALTSVADADLLGLETDLSPAAGARVSGTNKNVAKKIGYIGTKSYVSASVKSTVTAATPVAATVVLSHPIHAPAS